MLWDADFLLGEKVSGDKEKYVLCEINVSSVSPFPDVAIEPLTAATSKVLATIISQHARSPAGRSNAHRALWLFAARAIPRRAGHRANNLPGQS